MATYRKADEVEALVNGILADQYGELKKAGVTVSCLFAHAPRNKVTDEPTGPALKAKTGWPAMAVVKVNSLQDRVEGKADATIKVDGDNWPDWEDDRRLAVLDHVLYHLELVLDDEGQVKLDDEGQVKLDDAFRPKLKLRIHDWECSGFDAIVKRHGYAAEEARSVASLLKRAKQMQFPWGEG